MIDPQRCPNCDSPSWILRKCTSGETLLQIECQMCYLRGPVGAHRDDAVRAWNRLQRAPVTETPVHQELK